MESISLPPINGIDISDYKFHPRIIELRLVTLHHQIAMEFTDEIATNYFQLLCQAFRLNWTLVNSIILRRFDIKRLMKTNNLRYKQELILTGILFEETSYHIAVNYLNVTPGYLYKPQFRPQNFITEEWLDELDTTITVCGVPAYKNEAIHLIETIQTLQKALGNVSIKKGDK